MSAAPTNQNMGATSLTLGDLLYANPAITRVSEKEWLALVRAIAAGDELALRTLFERTYPLVFTYLTLWTGDRLKAESLILEVFELLWCEAPVFDPASAPVLGWVMRMARSRALAHADSVQVMQPESETIVTGLLKGLSHSVPGGSSTPSDARLQLALGDLSAREREVIEAALIDGWSYSELSQRRGEPIGAIKQQIGSALTKLRQSLREAGGEA